VVIPASTAQTDIIWDVCVETDEWSVCTQLLQEGDDSAYVNIVEDSSVNTAEATDILLHYTDRNIESLSVAVSYVISGTPQVQQDWIENVVLNTNAKTITAHLTANNLYTRRALIELTGIGTKGDTASDVCEVSQNAGGAADLDVNPQTIDFEFYEGSSTTKEVRITYGGNWTITEQ
jgi:hypothetical protein